jgi:hypothetical protein
MLPAIRSHVTHMVETASLNNREHSRDIRDYLIANMKIMLSREDRTHSTVDRYEHFGALCSIQFNFIHVP